MHKKSNSMLIVMYGICFVSSLCIWLFIYLTTERVILQFQAREFLSGVRAIPSDLNATLVKIILYLLLLGCSFFIRTQFGEQKPILKPLTLGADILLSIHLASLMHFSYNGVLLWCILNFAIYFLDTRYLPAVVVLGIGSYIATSERIAALWFLLLDITDYIAVYEPYMQQYLMVGLNLLQAITPVGFILCCLQLILTKEKTIEKANELYEQLSVANANLVKANKEMEDIMAENEKLAQIRERNRIAREIHDTMGHTLTGISAGIDACITIADSSPSLLKGQLKVLADVSRKGLADIRASVSSLRPDALERQSLDEALRQLMENTQRLTKVEIIYHCSEKNMRYHEDEENAIYRIIQESITNSIRHGHADRIEVWVERKYNDIFLRIADNGIGCKEFKEGFGTRHICERVEMMHGSVRFESRDGFLVEATVPIRWGERYD